MKKPSRDVLAERIRRAVNTLSMGEVVITDDLPAVNAPWAKSVMNEAINILEGIR